MLWIDHIATRYHLTLGGSLSTYLDSGANPIAGSMAAPRGDLRRHDRAFLHRRRRGREPCRDRQRRQLEHLANRRLRRGPGGFFDGLIDDVRIYDRALSASRDPGRPGPAARHREPGRAHRARQPHASPRATQTSISLNWTASTDDVGVAGYNVYVNGGAGGTTAATNFTINSLACSTGYAIEVEAFDGSGNTRLVRC